VSKEFEPQTQNKFFKTHFSVLCRCVLRSDHRTSKIFVTCARPKCVLKSLQKIFKGFRFRMSLENLGQNRVPQFGCNSGFAQSSRVKRQQTQHGAPCELEGSPPPPPRGWAGARRAAACCCLLLLAAACCLLLLAACCLLFACCFLLLVVCLLLLAAACCLWLLLCDGAVIASGLARPHVVALTWRAMMMMHIPV